MPLTIGLEWKDGRADDSMLCRLQCMVLVVAVKTVPTWTAGRRLLWRTGRRRRRRHRTYRWWAEWTHTGNGVKFTDACDSFLVLEMFDAEFHISCMCRLSYTYTVRMVAANTLVAYTQWSPMLNIWMNRHFPAGAYFSKLLPWMHCPMMPNCRPAKVWPYFACKTRMTSLMSSDVSLMGTAAFITGCFDLRHFLVSCTWTQLHRFLSTWLSVGL